MSKKKLNNDSYNISRVLVRRRNHIDVFLNYLFLTDSGRWIFFTNLGNDDFFLESVYLMFVVIKFI